MSSHAKKRPEISRETLLLNSKENFCPREKPSFVLQNVFASRENPFDCCTGGNGGIVLNKKLDQNRLSQESHISVILLGVLVQPGRH
jgi:hypothetical protein